MTLPEPQKQKIVFECIFAIKPNFLRAHPQCSLNSNQPDRHDFQNRDKKIYGDYRQYATELSNTLRTGDAYLRF
jgi:hypothetical protein